MMKITKLLNPNYQNYKVTKEKIVVHNIDWPGPYTGFYTQLIFQH